MDDRRRALFMIVGFSGSMLMADTDVVRWSSTAGLLFGAMLLAYAVRQERRSARADEEA